jgi:CRP/FNR family transcriptional regulator, anaerobic regulatory protein
MENLPLEPRTKVFIVEDSECIRERLIGLLAGMQGVSVVGEAATPRDAVEGILRTRPNLAVLDIHLTGGSGIDVLRKVHPQAPEVNFVVLTNHPNPQYRRACMELGASHFLDKTAEFAKVEEIIAGLGAPSAPGISKPDPMENVMTAATSSAFIRAQGAPNAREAGPSNLSKVQTRCSACNLRELCLPCGLTGMDIDRVEELVYTRRRMERGESLYRAGDKFSSLYAVRTGFFKTMQTLEDGRDQVTGFHMAGEIMGMDGIGPEKHGSSAVALEDSDVCVIPYSRLENLSRDMHGLQRQFHKVMSREIAQEHSVMLLLGTMRAEERLAAFLLNLSQRFTARGYSASEFNLRMTREEIGSYLGLKLETVSRAFSRFQEDGLISVQQKHIRILDVAGLKRCMRQKGG